MMDTEWPEWGACVSCIHQFKGAEGQVDWTRAKDFYAQCDFLMLPCLHFVCSPQCLDKLKDSQGSRCSCCAKVFAAEVVRSRGIIRPLEIMGLEDAESGPFVELPKTCESCIRNKNAVGRCQQCGITLCSICVDTHKVMRLTYTHQMSSENLKESVPLNRVCSTHEFRKLESYCQTCNAKLCGLCKRDHDSAHVILDISTFIQNIKEQLQGDLNQIYEVEAECREKEEKLEKEMEELLTTKPTEWINKAEKQLQKLMEVLRKKSESMKTAIKQKCSDRAAQLKGGATALAQTKNRTSQLITLGSSLSTDANVELAIRLRGILQSRTVSLKEEVISILRVDEQPLQPLGPNPNPQTVDNIFTLVDGMIGVSLAAEQDLPSLADGGLPAVVIKQEPVAPPEDEPEINPLSQDAFYMESDSESDSESAIGRAARNRKIKEERIDPPSEDSHDSFIQDNLDLIVPQPTEPTVAEMKKEGRWALLDYAPPSENSETMEPADGWIVNSQEGETSQESVNAEFPGLIVGERNEPATGVEVLELMEVVEVEVPAEPARAEENVALVEDSGIDDLSQISQSQKMDESTEKNGLAANTTKPQPEANVPNLQNGLDGFLNSYEVTESGRRKSRRKATQTQKQKEAAESLILLGQLENLEKKKDRKSTGPNKVCKVPLAAPTPVAELESVQNPTTVELVQAQIVAPIPEVPINATTAESPIQPAPKKTVPSPPGAPSSLESVVASINKDILSSPQQIENPGRRATAVTSSGLYQHQLTNFNSPFNPVARVRSPQTRPQRVNMGGMQINQLLSMSPTKTIPRILRKTQNLLTPSFPGSGMHILQQHPGMVGNRAPAPTRFNTPPRNYNPNTAVNTFDRLRLTLLASQGLPPTSGTSTPIQGIATSVIVNTPVAVTESPRLIRVEALPITAPSLVTAELAGGEKVNVTNAVEQGAAQISPPEIEQMEFKTPTPKKRGRKPNRRDPSNENELPSPGNLENSGDLHSAAPREESIPRKRRKPARKSMDLEDSLEEILMPRPPPSGKKRGPKPKLRGEESPKKGKGGRPPNGEKTEKRKYKKREPKSIDKKENEQVSGEGGDPTAEGQSLRNQLRQADVSDTQLTQSESDASPSTEYGSGKRIRKQRVFPGMVPSKEILARLKEADTSELVTMSKKRTQERQPRTEGHEIQENDVSLGPIQPSGNGVQSVSVPSLGTQAMEETRTPDVENEVEINSTEVVDKQKKKNLKGEVQKTNTSDLRVLVESSSETVTVKHTPAPKEGKEESGGSAPVEKTGLKQNATQKEIAIKSSGPGLVEKDPSNKPNDPAPAEKTSKVNQNAAVNHLSNTSSKPNGTKEVAKKSDYSDTAEKISKTVANEASKSVGPSTVENKLDGTAGGAEKDASKKSNGAGTVEQTSGLNEKPTEKEISKKLVGPNTAEKDFLQTSNGPETVENASCRSSAEMDVSNKLVGPTLAPLENKSGDASRVEKDVSKKLTISTPALAEKKSDGPVALEKVASNKLVGPSPPLVEKKSDGPGAAEKGVSKKLTVPTPTATAPVEKKSDGPGPVEKVASNKLVGPTLAPVEKKSDGTSSVEKDVSNKLTIPTPAPVEKKSDGPIALEKGVSKKSNDPALKQKDVSNKSAPGAVEKKSGSEETPNVMAIQNAPEKDTKSAGVSKEALTQSVTEIIIEEKEKSADEILAESAIVLENVQNAVVVDEYESIEEKMNQMFGETPPSSISSTQSFSNANSPSMLPPPSPKNSTSSSVVEKEKPKNSTSIVEKEKHKNSTSSSVVEKEKTNAGNLQNSNTSAQPGGNSIQIANSSEKPKNSTSSSIVEKEKPKNSTSTSSGSTAEKEKTNAGNLQINSAQTGGNSNQITNSSGSGSAVGTSLKTISLNANSAKTTGKVSKVLPLLPVSNVDSGIVNPKANDAAMCVFLSSLSLVPTESISSISNPLNPVVQRQKNKNSRNKSVQGGATNKKSTSKTSGSRLPKSTKSTPKQGDVNNPKQAQFTAILPPNPPPPKLTALPSDSNVKVADAKNTSSGMAKVTPVLQSKTSETGTTGSISLTVNKTGPPPPTKKPSSAAEVTSVLSLVSMSQSQTKEIATAQPKDCTKDAPPAKLTPGPKSRTERHRSVDASSSNNSQGMQIPTRVTRSNSPLNLNRVQQQQEQEEESAIQQSVIKHIGTKELTVVIRKLDDPIPKKTVPLPPPLLAAPVPPTLVPLPPQLKPRPTETAGRESSVIRVPPKKRLRSNSTDVGSTTEGIQNSMIDSTTAQPMPPMTKRFRTLSQSDKDKDNQSRNQTVIVKNKNVGKVLPLPALTPMRFGNVPPPRPQLLSHTVTTTGSGVSPPLKSGNRCAICLDEESGTKIFCDECPSAFHLNCHMPPLISVPRKNFRCFFCRPLADSVSANAVTDDNIRWNPNPQGIESNPPLFLKMCKLISEIFKSREGTSMREAILAPVYVGYDFPNPNLMLQKIRKRLVQKSPKPYEKVHDLVESILTIFQKFNEIDKLPDAILHLKVKFEDRVGALLGEYVDAK